MKGITRYEELTQKREDVHAAIQRCIKNKAHDMAHFWNQVYCKLSITQFEMTIEQAERMV
jgi:hypothetical protein